MCVNLLNQCVKVILNLLLCTEKFTGHYCSHDQYRCDHNNYFYYLMIYYFYYYSYNNFPVCIDSTLACNGKFDCYFGASDEERCGMFPIHVAYIRI